MNRKQLIQGLLDAAVALNECNSVSDIDFAADFASVLGYQASNLAVHLREKKSACDESSDNAEFIRQAADQTRPISAYAAEAVWCLRQVDQRKMNTEGSKS